MKENNKYLSKEECRTIEIKILDAISDLCKKNNLKYYMCGGTLLGAVRHKGFIPWDDDIDIMLLRPDYEKLINILKNQKEYSWLSVLDNKTKDYYYTFAKAVDNTTIAKQDDNKTEHGLWVDIFPYDNLPNNENKRKRFIMKGYFYRSIIMSFTTDFTSKDIKKKGIKHILKFYSLFINKEKFVKKYIKFSKKYSNVKDSNYVGCLFSPYKLKECFEKKWFDNQIEYIFENKKYSGPKEYDKYLSQLYGDYMKLPPLEKRRDHKMNAWKKN